MRPGGSGPWPAWVFINGAHPERRREPVVTRLSSGLARAGFIVFVPDLPGLGEGTITARTLESACAVTRCATEHEDVSERPRRADRRLDRCGARIADRGTRGACGPHLGRGGRRAIRRPRADDLPRDDAVVPRGGTLRAARGDAAAPPSRGAVPGRDDREPRKSATLMLETLARSEDDEEADPDRAASSKPEDSLRAGPCSPS